MKKFDTNFFERYAQITLETVLGDEFADLINRDRPDLQKPDMSLGIEVTRAMEPHKQAAMEMLQEMAGYDVHEKDHDEISQIIKSGYAYGLQEGKYIGHLEREYWSLALPLRRIIESKISKVASGFYGDFKEFGLYIFCKDDLTEEEVILAMEYASDLQRFLDVKYSKIYLSLIDRLYVCDMTKVDHTDHKTTISCYDISNDNRKKFFNKSMEQKYDFDKLIDRKGSGAVKTDGTVKFFGKDVDIPMWVADMDFEAPDFILNALKQRLEHPIFGYNVEPEDYRPAIVDWIRERHRWKIEKEWLSYIPGIVKGIGMVINALLEKDEKVIIQPPVYHPFRLVPQRNGREVVFNPLKEMPDGYYEMDFENLEAVCDDKCKLLILANPHNPAGIVWPRETLQKLAEFCYKKGVIVISDEIHCDMALYGHKHIPFASVSPEAAACSITFGAPSKTFNLAGIVSSYSIIPNDELREKFYSWLEASEMGAAPIFSYIATIAAFRKGEEWRKQMIEYIQGNIDLVISYCKEHIPQIRPLRPQASFLVWLDCRELGLSHEELTSLFLDKAGLGLNDGEMFNPGGEGFMRLNIGTPRSILLEALEKLEKAIKKNRLLY